MSALKAKTNSVSGKNTVNATRIKSGKNKKTVIEAVVETTVAPSVKPAPQVDPLGDLKAAYNQGNDKQALALAATHLAEQPDNLVILKMVARIHNRLQDWPAAKEVWSRLLTLEPQSPEPPLQLARIASRNKQPAEALALFDKVLALAPAHEEALITKITLLTNIDDMSAAVSAAHQLVQAGIHGKPEPLIKLARQLFDKHQLQGDALEIASLATAIAPENADALKLRAKILATLQTDAIAAHLEGDDDEAAKACRNILRSLPHHERASSILREIVRPLLVAARPLYKSEQPETAIKAYEGILAVDPNHAESLRTLARLHAKNQDDAKAEEFWARLEKITPDDSEPTLQLARLRAKAGDSESALSRYNKLANMPGTFADEAATNRDRMAARVLRNAAVKARDLELDEALRLAELVAALKTPPENLVEVMGRIEVLSAREAAHAFKAQDNATATAHAKRALKLNANNEKALMILARAAHKVQDYRSALDAWRGISAQQPVNAEAWLQKARYYLRFREYPNAIKACKKLLALEPSHAEAATILETANIRATEPQP